MLATGWTVSTTALSYSLPGGIYTNGAEGFFSRPRRAEIGHHHHVAGAYLVRHAQERARREDHRRVADGEQVRAVMGLAMRAPVFGGLVRVLAAPQSSIKRRRAELAPSYSPHRELTDRVWQLTRIRKGCHRA
jgi:hypothetical protein